MIDKLKSLVPSESTRAYLYRVSVVVLPLLVAYGAVNENQAALWVSAAGTILVPGLAAANTTTKKPGGKHRAA